MVYVLVNGTLTGTKGQYFRTSGLMSPIFQEPITSTNVHNSQFFGQIELDIFGATIQL